MEEPFEIVIRNVLDNRITIQPKASIGLTLQPTAGNVVNITKKDNIAVSLTNQPPISINFTTRTVGSGTAFWGTISGTITNQTDLVTYVADQIANIPAPATPTLQSVTDAGAITTNDITIGTTVLRSGSYLNVKPVSNYGILIRNSGDDNKYISMGVPGDYGFIKYKENSASAITLNAAGVGIGTTSPQQKLHVGGVLMAQNIGGSFERSIGLFPGNYEQTLKYSGTGLVIQNSSNDNDLGAGGGNVVVKLSPYATNDRTTTLSLGNKNQQSLVHTSANGLLTINNATSGGVMAFDLNGNVGIGTTAPSEILQVGNDSVGENYIQIAKKDNTGAGIKISETGSTRIGFLRVNQSEDLEIGTEFSNDVDIFTNGVSRVTIDGDFGPTQGYVGIGTTAPASKLQISTSGTDSTTSAFSIQNGNGLTTFEVNDGSQAFVEKELYVGDNYDTDSRLYLGSRGAFLKGYYQEIQASPSFFALTISSRDLQIKSANQNYNGSFLKILGQGNGYYTQSLGGIYWSEVNRESTHIGAKIEAITDTKYSDTEAPTNLMISTTPAGQLTPEERMRITSDGNVGIGTTAPQQKLHVDGTIRIGSDVDLSRYAGHLRTAQDLVLGSLNYEGANLTINADSTQNAIGVRRPPSGTTSILKVRDYSTQDVYVDIDSDGVADFAGMVKTDTGFEAYRVGARRVFLGGTSVNGQLLLDSGGTWDVNLTGGGNKYFANGNFGIGTTAPAHVLHINKDNPYIQIQDSSAPTRADMSAGIIMKDSTGAQSFGITQSNSVDVSIRANAGDLSLGTFAGTVIKLDGNNVGIGTTSPSNKLQVATTGPNSTAISTLNALGNVNTQIGSNSNNGLISILNSVGSVELIKLNGGGNSYINIGNVGIGTTAPDSKLHVKATSGIAFKVDPNNADKEWYIDTTNPDHLKKEGNLILNADPTNVHTSTKISFNIDGSNKASINSDGDLGVGTTAQTSKVHVDGTAMRQLRIGTAGGPSSNTDTSGAEGDIAYDDLYLYIKTGSGWGRVALDFAF